MNDDGSRETQWLTVRRKGKIKQTNAGERPKSVKRSVKKKGEAIVVKEGYLEVLRTTRTAPELKNFGADVQKVRLTRSAEMIFDLKKRPRRTGALRTKSLRRRSWEILRRAEL